MPRLYRILLLAFVLAVQSSWSVAAGYCGHDEKAKQQQQEQLAAKHFGHHEHDHEHEAPANSSDTAVADFDHDGDCHLNLVALTDDAPAAGQDALHAPLPPASPRTAAAPAPDRPERPRWLRA